MNRIFQNKSKRWGYQLLDAWFGNIVYVLDAGRTAYIWGGYANIANYPKFLKQHGLYLSQCLVWNKLHPVLTRKDFLCAYELCFYCWKEGAGHKFFGPNNVPDLWDVKKIASQNMVHLTEKPVELAIRAIQYSSQPGENVLEIFGGSGSTLIACEQTERKCYCMPPIAFLLIQDTMTYSSYNSFIVYLCLAQYLSYFVRHLLKIYMNIETILTKSQKH